MNKNGAKMQKIAKFCIKNHLDCNYTAKILNFRRGCENF
jgi:hypothetical protein